jgi:hypothetical protein
MSQADKLLPRPPWLDDELELIAALNYFLNRLDKQPASEREKMPSFRLIQKNVPKLFRQNEAADRTWDLIKSLDGLLFDIRLPRKRSPYDAEFAGASLIMIASAEDSCREWLNRPVINQYQQEWEQALDAHAGVFADKGCSLRARPQKVVDQSAASIVRAYASITDYLDRGFTLRQLSARCFWGNSKFLDTREDVLRQLFPELQIAPRPILVNVHLPEQCNGILLIENQDNYIQALQGYPKGLRDFAVIFVAGFRGSAERIRMREGVSLHYQGDYDAALKQQFESYWFAENDSLWPVWFWGDLDFSGMGILKALRQRFAEVQAWPDGYEPLLQVLNNGGGHSPGMADKTEQVDPGLTGCDYADEMLLPAIRSSGRFVDQEMV